MQDPQNFFYWHSVFILYLCGTFDSRYLSFDVIQSEKNSTKHYFQIDYSNSYFY